MKNVTFEKPISKKKYITYPIPQMNPQKLYYFSLRIGATNLHYQSKIPMHLLRQKLYYQKLLLFLVQYRLKGYLKVTCHASKLLEEYTLLIGCGG